MRKYLFGLLAFLAFGSIQAQNSTTPKTQGLLWEITGNGLSKPSYLYGTMHISGKLAFNLSDSFYLAIKSVNTVALELDPSLWLMQMIEEQKASNSREVIPNEFNFFQQNNTIYSASQVQLFNRDRLPYLLGARPRVANQMLYRTGSSGEGEDYEEDTYLDLFIYQTGKKFNKQLIGLEDYIQTEILVNKAYRYREEYSEEELEKFREESSFRVEQLTQKYDKSLDQIRDEAYRSGDLDLLDSIGRLEAPIFFTKYMLWERNRLMVNRMDSIMRTGSLFTAIGAGHLPGENGVIAMLRAMGYQVRPITFTSSKTDKQKKITEKMKYPVELVKQFSKDSTFSFVAPPSLLLVNQGMGIFEYLHNDMANGSYYYILEVPHNAAFTNKSLEDTWKQVDSIIYESVPGKILSRKRIKSNTGWDGFDITSRTRHGDIQRFQLFVGPYAYHMFLMSGQLNYVQGNEGKAFFSSIKFAPKSGNQWLTFSPNYGGFSVKTPEIRSVTEQQINDVGYDRVVIESADAKNQFYYFSETIDQSTKELEEDTFELSYLFEVMVDAVEGEIVSSFVDHKAEIPTFYGVYSKNGGNIYVRTSLNGNRYYILATNASDEQDRKSYFNSFSIQPFIYQSQKEVYFDSLLQFSVMQVPNKNPYKAILSEVKGLSDYGKNELKLYHESEFEYNSQSKRIPCKETGEFVNVDFEVYSKFFNVPDMDSLWNSRLTYYKNNSMVWKSRQEFTNNQKVREFLMTDTACSRAIYVKIMGSCKGIHTLTTVVDANKPFSPFVKEVFSTFKPVDSCFGGDPLKEDLTTIFFPNLYSKDTTMQKKIANGFGSAMGNLLPKHENHLIKAISDSSFHNLTMFQKYQLIRGLADLKKVSSLPFFEKMYSDYSDSTDIQYEILGSVARMKLPAATQLVMKLMQKEIPSDGESSGFANVLSGLSDSLQLAAKCYPDLLKFTKYKEFKGAIYDLMATLVDSGFLNSTVYAANKKDIVEDALYEIKVIASNSGSRALTDYSSTYVTGNYDETASDYSESGFGGNGKFTEIPFTTNSRIVVNYLRILAPFCQDADVKKVIDRVFKLESAFDRMLPLMYLASKKISIPDSNWTVLTSRPEYRISAYSLMKHYKMLNKFPETYLNAQSMAEGVAATNVNFDSFSDSIVFIKSEYQVVHEDSGLVFVFKMKKKDEPFFESFFVGFQPKDGKNVRTKQNIFENGGRFETEDELNKQLKEFKKSLRTYNRNKVPSRRQFALDF